MTWAYSGNPATSDLDQVRFTLQDTDTSFQLLANEEINFLIAFWMPKYDSLTFVAAVCAEVVSRKFAGIVNVSSDGVSVDTSTLSDRFHTSAIRLRDEYRLGAIGVLDLENLMTATEIDYSIAPLRFGVGLHDNRLIGNQDFGSWKANLFSLEDVMNGLA